MHMVIFRSPDGKPGYHQAESLDEATQYAERLRNVEGVGDSRIFRMEEVPIEFKPYFRVEIVGGEAAPVAAADASVDDVVPSEGVDEPVAEVADGDSIVPEPVALNNGRFGLFSRS
jgi:hypothetical protein